MSRCLECGQQFLMLSGTQLYCSPECGKAYRKRNKRTDRISVTFTCAKCGRVVVTEPERGDRRERFCCVECEKKYWRHPPKEGKEVRNYTCAEVYMAYERRTNEHF